MADFIPIPAMRRRVLVTEHDDVRGLLLLLGIVIFTYCIVCLKEGCSVDILVDYVYVNPF